MTEYKSQTPKSELLATGLMFAFAEMISLQNSGLDYEKYILQYDRIRDGLAYQLSRHLTFEKEK